MRPLRPRGPGGCPSASYTIVIVMLLLHSGGAAFVTDLDCSVQCDHGQPTTVRWGNPGLYCLLTVLGNITLSDPSVAYPVPWTVATLYATVLPTQATQFTAQYVQGVTKSAPDVVTVPEGAEVCVAIPRTGALDMALCLHPTRSDTSDGGMIADVIVDVTVKATPPGGAAETLYTTTVSDPRIDCRIRTKDATVIAITLFLCLLAPVLIFFFCPLPTAHRLGMAEVDHDLAPTLGTRARKLARKIWLALGDSNMWGSFTFLAASAAYLHARVSPEYLDAHPQYRDVLYIVAAALYVHSAVCYHIAWEGCPTHPTIFELWESYLNIVGSSGFVASAVMYLWSDYSSLGRPTAEVELTFYILWFLEEVCNGYASFEWWAASNQPLSGLSWWQYTKLVASGLVSITFWANAFSLIGSATYVYATGMLVAREYTRMSFYNNDEFVAEWSGVAGPAPFEYVKESPDLDFIQGAGDVFYFVDSVLFMWVAWQTFDIQVSNEPLPNLPLPSDLSPTEAVYRPDSPNESETSTRQLVSEDEHAETLAVEWVEQGAVTADASGRAASTPPRTVPRVVPLRQMKRFSMRRECVKHVCWPFWFLCKRVKAPNPTHTHVEMTEAL